MTKKKVKATPIAKVEENVETAVIETAAEVNETADLDDLDSLISLSKTENRGRHVDPNSARQLRIAVKAALQSAGMLPGRGRKIDSTSVRQLRLNAFAAKWAGSEAVKRGRPKKPVIAPTIEMPTVVVEAAE